jgi:hypothetical protein
VEGRSACRLGQVHLRCNAMYRYNNDTQYNESQQRDATEEKSETDGLSADVSDGANYTKTVMGVRTV